MRIAFGFTGAVSAAKSNVAASGKGSVNVVKFVVLVRCIVTRVG